MTPRRAKIEENWNMTSSSPTPSLHGHPKHLVPSTPIVEELVPAPDGWQVFERLACLPRAIFLDSASAESHLGRYSFVTADPFEWFCSHGLPSVADGERLEVENCNPFDLLTARLQHYQTDTLNGLPPFQGGAAGLFGYGLCHHLERLPRPRFDEFQVPELAIGLYDWVISFDHQSGQAWLISTGFPESNANSRGRRAARRLKQVKRLLSENRFDQSREMRWNDREELRSQDLARALPVANLPGLLSNFSRSEYLQAVRRVIEYLRAGDCFQVNLAQRLLFPADGVPCDLYGRLRARNSAPFAGYFDLGNFAIASASPERFLSCRSGVVQTRPIKGTKPRGGNSADDRAFLEALLASSKDRAENVMIVDLLRNDLGRVCSYGSIHVPRLCEAETHPFVHHLVSEVRGRLRTGLGPIDLLKAAFPGGSVTGAPKIRAMEIIAELEPTARGAYCGSLGYIGFDNTMDTSILIRTFTIGRGWVQFPVGGGIVADSTPEAEYDETWHKAEGMLRALTTG
jgi:para-aminobenzoate synthetase component 1